MKKLLLLLIFPLVFGAGCSIQTTSLDPSLSQPDTVKQVINTDTQKTDNTVKKQEVQPTITAPKPLEPVDYYENTAGNTVQSPTLYDSRPSGASAKCKDGTYSFSQSRRGTCSHHGGVAVWY